MRQRGMANNTRSESVEAATRYLATYSENVAPMYIMVKLECARAAAKTEKAYTILAEMCEIVETLAHVRFTR